MHGQLTKTVFEGLEDEASTLLLLPPRVSKISINTKNVQESARQASHGAKQSCINAAQQPRIKPT